MSHSRRALGKHGGKEQFGAFILKYVRVHVGVSRYDEPAFAIYRPLATDGIFSAEGGNSDDHPIAYADGHIDPPTAIPRVDHSDVIDPQGCRHRHRLGESRWLLPDRMSHNGRATECRQSGNADAGTP
ncbi:electron transport complex subunit D [Mycolicibacterium canariasense]|uniref:Electron transport complex subunit D n=1 Tax=Mycolicibacterium canariasense TaxID=228230 RepID=A0A124E1J0_MYCCR|nr:hypothetical protein AWB94_32525 [Mycolicibacterium canariasense]GAS93858.1 electron transport complex subunit D [Mycolicibacterium canariasense]